MSDTTSLSSALRAVAERVEQGETFPVALRNVARELDAFAAALPDWHLAVIDEALADPTEASEPWENALAQIRDEVSRT